MYTSKKALDETARLRDPSELISNNSLRLFTYTHTHASWSKKGFTNGTWPPEHNTLCGLAFQQTQYNLISRFQLVGGIKRNCNDSLSSVK